jgi:hypothetical protein
MADPKSSTSVAVVELMLSGPGFTDAERFELPDDRGARAFARDVMSFALDPSRGRRRQRATADASERTSPREEP